MVLTEVRMNHIDMRDPSHLAINRYSKMFEAIVPLKSMTFDVPEGQ